MANLQAFQDAIDRAKPIELARHYALNEELWRLEHAFEAGAIGARERNVHAQTVHTEKRASTIIFPTEDDFKAYCEWHSGALHREYVHEAQHAVIYRKHNIPCTFGFIKVSDHGHIGLLPWITPEWPQGISRDARLRITLESLENAREKSAGDLQDIAALRRILTS